MLWTRSSVLHRLPLTVSRQKWVGKLYIHRAYGLRQPNTIQEHPRVLQGSHCIFAGPARKLDSIDEIKRSVRLLTTYQTTSLTVESPPSSELLIQYAVRYLGSTPGSSH